MAARLVTLMGLILLSGLASKAGLAESQRWTIQPGSSAELVADLYFFRRCPIAGRFEDKVIDAKFLQAVTGTVMTHEENGKLVLDGVDGYIEGKTAWVPNQHLLGLLDDPTMLHYSRHPRIHVRSGKPDIQPSADGKSFDIQATLFIKTPPDEETATRGKRVAMRGTLAKGPDGKIRLSFVSVGEPGLPPGRVSRKKLGISGYPSLLYDEIGLSVSAVGALAKSSASSRRPREPRLTGGDLPRHAPSYGPRDMEPGHQ